MASSPIEYVKNSNTDKIMNQGSSSGSSSGISSGANQNLFLTDIAQSHHFTIRLENMPAFRTPEGSFSEFLPVKSINLTYTSYENMTIPVSIFGDFPLLNKKRVSTIALTCFDTDDNKLEHEILKWEDRCFPKGRFVAYMEDIVKELTYKGYNVKGKETFKTSFYVIPSGGVSVSRDYSANDTKLITFNLVCVGDGSTCATGASKQDRTNSSQAAKTSKKEDSYPEIAGTLA